MLEGILQEAGEQVILYDFFFFRFQLSFPI